MLREVRSIEGIAFKDRTNNMSLAPVTVVDSELLRASSLVGVLMCANVNVKALQLTLDTGYATFWSRSRQGLWVKGESSGNKMPIRGIYADCDLDAIVYDVIAPEAACHRGTVSCFEM